MRCYVAANSAHVTDAQQAMAALRAAGHTVTHDWTDEVLHYQETGDMPKPEQCATACIEGVRTAEVLVLLYDTPGRGKWVELGAALAFEMPVLAVCPQEVLDEVIFLWGEGVEHCAEVTEAIERLQVLEDAWSAREAQAREDECTHDEAAAR